MRVLVTGGAGYVGSRLVPRLLDAGHDVLVYDTLWFGDHLPRLQAGPGRDRIFPKGNILRVVEGDIRHTDFLKHKMRWGRGPTDVVMHLACVSNDPSFELDESLSRTINYECFEPMVIAAKEAGVKRFIYCSTSSVYGVSDSPNVTEDHPLVPLTLYNTYKGKCEPLLFKHQADDFICTTIRPSTICGYSPRQRLDLAVNILTNLAVNKREIIVHGGSQMRPNLHIEDMVDVYMMLLDAPADKIAGQTFNVGQRNYSISQLARIVQTVVQNLFPDGPPIAIRTEAVVDNRSYQVSSEKIARVLGYRPKRTVQDAVADLCFAFRDGLLPNSLEDDRYYNVKRMRTVWGDLYKDAPEPVFDPTKGHLSEIDVMHRTTT